MDQYPREAWRPILEGNLPAFEQEWELPARAWDLVEGLHRRPHHHIVSRDQNESRTIVKINGATDMTSKLMRSGTKTF